MTKPPLDKKALEAAVDDWLSACGYTRRDGDVGRATDQQRLDYLIARFIAAADLVPRQDQGLDLVRWEMVVKERDEARAQVGALLDVHSKEHGELQMAYETALCDRAEARAQLAALRDALEQMGKEADENTKRHHQPTIGYFFMAGVAETVPKLLTDTAEAARGYQLVDDEHVVMPMEPTNRILEYLYGPFLSASSHQSRIDAYKTAMQLTPTATPDPEDG